MSGCRQGQEQEEDSPSSAAAARERQHANANAEALCRAADVAISRACCSSAAGAMDGGFGTPDHLRLSRLDRLIGELGQHQLSLRQQVRA